MEQNMVGLQLNNKIFIIYSYITLYIIIKLNWLYLYIAIPFSFILTDLSL